jgi:hypothetical protein
VLALLRELSALPYENLSKIVAFHHSGNSAGVSPGTASGIDLRKVERALDLSSGWLDHSRETGAGGTCFSLTWWLRRRMGEAGFPSEFLMADKGRSADIHCGLRFEWRGRAYLLDPGYMIFDPLPLPSAGLSAAAWIPPNEVRVEDVPAGPPPGAKPPGGRPAPEGCPAAGLGDSPGAARVWRLWSGPRGAPKWRFDFRQAPVGEAEFVRHWEASYALPMMGYPVLNRIEGGVQYYLQKRSLLVRTAEGSEMRKLGREEMLETLGRTFCIPDGLAREALEIVTARDPRFFGK